MGDQVMKKLHSSFLLLPVLTFLSLFLSLFLSCSSQQEEHTGVTIGTTNGISGTVQDSSGASLAGVPVYLVHKEYWAHSLADIDSVILDSTTTNDSGYFGFPDLEGQEYTILMSQDDKALLSDTLFDEHLIFDLPTAYSLCSQLQNIDTAQASDPQRFFFGGTPIQTNSTDESKCYNLRGIPQGNYIAGILDSTADGWVYSFPKVFRTDDMEMNDTSSIRYSTGEVLLENFESDRLPLASFVSPFKIYWTTAKSNPNTFISSPPLADSAFIRSEAESDEASYDGRSLKVDYFVSNDVLNSHVILKLGFKPAMRIERLDSLSFWYKSSAELEIEITRGDSSEVVRRQISKSLDASDNWKQAVIKPSDFQNQLDSNIEKSWEIFSRRIINMQFEFRKKGNQTFEMDEFKAHGFLVEGLNLFAEKPE